MSVNDNTKFLENINQGFKRILPWNKYISALTSQSKNKNLDKYYMSVEEIKDFNTLIDNTPFFDQPVKNKEEE